MIIHWFICSNGLGHLRRSTAVLGEICNCNPHLKVRLYISKDMYLSPWIDFPCEKIVYYPTDNAWSLTLSSDLVIKSEDIIVSDNFLSPLYETRPKSFIFLSSFSWELSMPGISNDLINKARCILHRANTYLIVNTYFASPQLIASCSGNIFYHGLTKFLNHGSFHQNDLPTDSIGIVRGFSKWSLSSWDNFVLDLAEMSVLKIYLGREFEHLIPRLKSLSSKRFEISYHKALNSKVLFTRPTLGSLNSVLSQPFRPHIIAVLDEDPSRELIDNCNSLLQNGWGAVHILDSDIASVMDNKTCGGDLEIDCDGINQIAESILSIVSY